MKIYRFNYQNSPSFYEDFTLCLGFFDGLHLGHQTLIKKAKESNKKVGVMTFSSSFKKNDKSITTLNDKINLLDEMDIDYLFIVENTIDLMNLNAIDFIENVLKKINPSSVVCGSDFRFGHFGKGDSELLKQYFPTTVVELLPLGENKISSSWIRDLIEEGDIKLANELLSRPYKITTRIVNGKGNGASIIGFPTINLDLLDYVVPKYGVYYVKFYINNTFYECIANVGKHPTIDKLEFPIIEVFIPENIDISSMGASIEFLHFERGEKQFEDVNKLNAQISYDVEQCKKYFENDKK